MNQFAKRLAVIAAALVSITVPLCSAHAQTGAPMAPPTLAQQQQMLKNSMVQAEKSFVTQLGITSAQRPKVHTAFTHLTTQTQGAISKFVPKMTAIMKKYGPNPTPDQMQKARAEAAPIQKEVTPLMMQIQKNFNTEVLAILTPAQQTKFKSMMAAAQNRQRPR